jgi:hypothetical protein
MLPEGNDVVTTDKGSKLAGLPEQPAITRAEHARNQMRKGKVIRVAI